MKIAHNLLEVQLRIILRQIFLVSLMHCFREILNDVIELKWNYLHYNLRFFGTFHIWLIDQNSISNSLGLFCV